MALRLSAIRRKQLVDPIGLEVQEDEGRESGLGYM